ncbi:MAG: glycoside hydrolase family 9 protein [Defluviitaleaceae bacterium]|nr:glycoside hydrolase family 9 protein [Defluviitaleaceae bacterium]
MSAWIRINQAGYKPSREKIAIVLSDNELSNENWCIKKDGKEVLSGNLESPGKGDDIHSVQAFNYAINFSNLREAGVYTIELANAEPQNIKITEDPYSHLAEQAIFHLHTMRSGVKTPLTNAAHLKDNAAIAYIVDGDWENGAWKEATPRRTIEMQGGHYDAGDCIKFTLTTASMVWHLLRAYEENPKMFTKSTETLPEILAEAKHSLDYLTKTFPDENTFVIQVGSGEDHSQGWRLPENDALDGKRPAFCALSRAHMGATAATLALGAHIFKNRDENAAELYKSKAIAIYARAKKPDTQKTAFERDATNDFYYDKDDIDNMALAAAELYNLTSDQAYLDDAKRLAPPPAITVSWRAENGSANHRLAQHGDTEAKSRFLSEVSAYNSGNLWKLPGGEYAWGSLPVWMGMANNMLLAQRLNDPNSKKHPEPFEGVLDYTFGRNNWGIALMVSEDLPHSIKNIYGFVRNVLDKLAVGALSEGPGKKATHDKFKHYFKTPENNPFEQFNTSAAVFYDDSYDFMLQESTIWGQGNFILLLALAGL